MTEPTYDLLNFINDTAPAINANDLNHMDAGIQAATVRSVASVRYDAAQTLTAAQQTQALDNMSAVPRAQVTAPIPTSLVTQGLYARTVPAPSGESSITALCTDPNNAGYLWALGATSGKIGYTSDNGGTFTAVLVNPAASQAIVQAVITTNWMWLLTAGSTSKSGQAWRSPAPNATGSNLAFTKIFDLTGLVNGPGGAVASGPSNSSFRVGCMAIQPDESAMYLLTYAAGNDTLTLGGGSDGIMSAGSDLLYSPGSSGSFTGCTVGASITVTGAGAAGGTLSTTIVEIYSNKKVRLADCAQTSVSAAAFTQPSQQYGNQAVIGGPFFYVSNNPGAASASTVTFSNTKFWGFAKHGHSVKIIGGVPWVSLGDYPFPSGQYGYPPTTHVGVWAATSAAATTFTQVTAATQVSPYDLINIFPIVVGGQPMIVGESDNKFGTGPIIIPTQTGSSTVVPQSPMKSFLPNLQTMRSLCVTPEGNLMWYGTGESGAVGPVDGVWISKSPFDRAFLLESLTLGTIGNPNEAIVQGAYVWIGNNRIVREKFLGQ